MLARAEVVHDGHCTGFSCPGITHRSTRSGDLRPRILMLVNLPTAPGLVTKILTITPLLSSRFSRRLMWMVVAGREPAEAVDWRPDVNGQPLPLQRTVTVVPAGELMLSIRRRVPPEYPRPATRTTGKGLISWGP